MMAEIEPIVIKSTGGSAVTITMRLQPAAFYSCSAYKVGSMPHVQGSAASSAAFPMQYAENFENYGVRSMVRYLTAEGGIFETAERPADMNSSGRLALQQILTEKPISWYSDPLPFATLGDPSPFRWQNYTVSVTVFIPTSASAKSVPVPVAMDACSGSAAQAWIWRAIPVRDRTHQDFAGEVSLSLSLSLSRARARVSVSLCARACVHACKRLSVLHYLE